MEKRKIVVPEAMLEAVRRAIDVLPEGWRLSRRTIAESAVVEALRWLSENPIAPTTCEARELRSACAGQAGAQEEQSLATSWQRRMFLAPKELTPVPCCFRDTDSDGNCPVHLAPGVYRDHHYIPNSAVEDLLDLESPFKDVPAAWNRGL